MHSSLANPRKCSASIVISMSVYLSVCLSLREDISGKKCHLCQIFGACCLRSWFDLPPAKGAKSTIYDCLVQHFYYVEVLFYSTCPRGTMSHWFNTPV